MPSFKNISRGKFFLFPLGDAFKCELLCCNRCLDITVIVMCKYWRLKHLFFESTALPCHHLEPCLCIGFCFFIDYLLARLPLSWALYFPSVLPHFSCLFSFWEISSTLYFRTYTSASFYIKIFNFTAMLTLFALNTLVLSLKF